ncbi:hypothetical protein L1987_65126 [Smallanthus sonchifolius]|uniref:Uncharacterized protein n=1 Tax=Smallanthus sonchifolius TaxID=185202 RepID=A0ACB9BTP1_9ASTR|nr:hypothetical protein L1987_65126 [Smallanthus sonchifolius]
MGLILAARRSPKKWYVPSPDPEPLQKKHCPPSQREIKESSHPVRLGEAGTVEQIRLPSIGMSEPQTDKEAQLSKSTTVDTDAVIEALDDRLVQLQGVVDLADSALGRLHGRVATGETSVWIHLQPSPS